MAPFNIRRSGILLHPTSFPGPWGIGDLGKAAYGFVDFLAGAGQQIWQTLPLGPVAENGSPYSSFSSTAGNPLLISPEMLADDGLLDLNRIRKPKQSARINYKQELKLKRSLLTRAYGTFPKRTGLHDAFDTFRADEADWLDDYSLFMALKDTYPGRAWNRWPRDLATRKAAAVKRARNELAGLVGYHRFTQFIFYRQWTGLKRYAHENGIRIVGDIPFYVAFDSADVWANPKNFMLDRKTGAAALMAGVPPDYFSKTGQLWGNPVYNGKHLENDGFTWWIERFRRLTGLVDIVRIDHFRGFEAFWQVPAGQKTAINGTWEKFPGDAFFHTLDHALGHLPVWAEDLGVITPGVEALRDRFRFPGMKVLQFAFDDNGAENPYLPINFPRNCVCYTGTHDNNTTRGWWSELDRKSKQRVRQYLGDGENGSVTWPLIRAAMASVANDVVIPLQDILDLGGDARMNIPGREAGNWGWRFKDGALKAGIRKRLEEMTETYGRKPKHRIKQGIKKD